MTIKKPKLEKQLIGYGYQMGFIGGYDKNGYVCDDCGKETNSAMRKKKGESIEDRCYQCFIQYVKDNL